MSRHIPEHPKKGSVAAYEWAERMRQARQKKARTKARVREAGQLTEMQFFGPGGSLEAKPRTQKNPGARYHEEAAQIAGRYRKDGASNTDRALYAGMEIAHKDSAKAARKLHMNPRRPQPRKAFHLYDNLTRKIVETFKTANEAFDVISSQRLNRKRFVVTDEFMLRIKKRTPEVFIENLTRQCAWCKKAMGETIPYSDTRPTHGICEACLKKEMKAAQKITKNPHMFSSRWEVVRLKDGATQEMSYQSASRFYGKSGYDVRMIALKKPKKRITKNPIAVYNPPAPKVAGVIYNKAIEIRAKKTGSDLAGKYKHVFGKNVKILGLDNGDVVIHHTGGKRLWVSRKDYERAGGEHE